MRVEGCVRKTGNGGMKETPVSCCADLLTRNSRKAETGEKTIGGLFSDILEKYPDVSISTRNLDGSDGIRQFASGHYGSLQLVISPEALKRMAGDPEFKRQCEETLIKTLEELERKLSSLQSGGKTILGKGLYLDVDGKVSQWVASERPDKKFQETLPWKMTTVDNKKNSVTDRYRTKDGKTFEITKKLSYRPARDLLRIARAHSQQEVKTAMGGVRYQIYQMKVSSGDKNKSRQLINQAEQVIRKAQYKVKQLKKEELMKQSEKHARERQKAEKAALIRRQLKDHQIKRKVREYGQIRDYYPTPQEIAREKEHARDWLEQVAGGSLSGGDYGLGAYLSSPVASGGGVVSGGDLGAIIDITL